MSDFAQRLMTLHTGVQADSSLPSAIFGSVGMMGQNLETRDRVRIAMWPILSKSNPVIGMGLSLVLAHRLEQYASVRVYRLFTRAEENTDAYDWRANYGDLTIDNWQLDRLDDNTSVWGELAQEGGQYKLRLEIESELSDDEESKVVTVDAQSLADLLTQLDLAEAVDAELGLTPIYEDCKATDEQLVQLFEMLIDWETHLQLMLWGREWDVHEALELLQELVAFTIEIDDPFSAWIAGRIIAHGMEPGYGDLSDALADVAPEMPEQFNHAPLASASVARALYHLGRTEAAYELLEAEAERNSAAVEIWTLLGLLYHLGGRLFDGLETYQRAIEQEVTNKRLYQQYVSLIQGFHQNQLTFDEFVLIDPDDYGEVSDTYLMGWEAAKGYQAAIKLDSTDERIHYLLVMQLLALAADEGPLHQFMQYLSNNPHLQTTFTEEDNFWWQFEQYLSKKPDSGHLQTIIGEMDQLEDITPAIEILEKLTEPDDASVDLMLVLASLYTLEDENDRAMDLLERAETMTDDPGVLAEIDHLFLSAEDPEFDIKLGDIDALVQAGTELSSGDFDFLEDALERAPAMIDLYIILGRAYETVGDDDAALETLLDGHKQAPNDPDLLHALGSLLWEMEQEELAFDYLNKGIATSPNHVPLLATTGQYLFEDGQDEKARVYLARAERISPRHPALSEARRVIVELMNERNA